MTKTPAKGKPKPETPAAAPALVTGLRITASKENQALWKPAQYIIATNSHGELQQHGFIYKGLGLHKHDESCQCKGGAEVWALSHLGSGHLIFNIKGSFGQAVEIGTMAATLGDWEFGGLKGFHNVSPDLMEKVKMLFQMFSQYAFIEPDDPGPNPRMADKIAKKQTVQ